MRLNSSLRRKLLASLFCRNAFFSNLRNFLRKVGGAFPFGNHEVAPPGLKRFDHDLRFATELLFKQRGTIALRFTQKESNRTGRWRALRGTSSSCLAPTVCRDLGWRL